MTDIVCGARYCLEFHKGQFSDLCCSIFSYAMFYFLEDFDNANSADGSTPSCAGESAKFVVNNLEQ